MNRRHIFTVATFLAAIALGIVAGWGARSILKSNESSEPASAQSAMVSPGVAEARRSESSGGGDALAESLASAQGATRWLLWLESAEKAQPSDMMRLIRLSGGDDVVIRMLAARWAELDPRHMCETLALEYAAGESDGTRAIPFSTLSDVLFQEWTRRDPTAAIAALNRQSNLPGIEGLRMTMTDRIIRQDPERGLRLMKEWNISSFIPTMKAVGAWAEREPRRAVEAAIGAGSDYAQREALSEVGKAWAKSDPAAALAHAESLTGESRGVLAASVIKQWAEKDLAAAAASVASHPDSFLRAEVAGGLVEVWARSDPEGALEWSQQHLKGEARANAVSNLVKSAASRNIDEAARMVAGLEAGGARNLAVASLLEVWGGGEKRNPEGRAAALEWLAGLDDAEAQESAMERIHWRWFHDDPDAATAFLEGPHGHMAPASTVRQITDAVARRNPIAAIEWTETLPTATAAQARSHVLDTWLHIRPEAAANWILELPAGERRQDAIKQSIQRLAQLPDETADAWFARLQPAERATARERLSQAQLDPARRARLEKILAD